jgi:glycyl-tRNA synthetase alpha chain
VERRVRAAQPPPDRRPLWREPEPAAALLPVSGDPEAQPGNLQELYLNSLRTIGVDPLLHDIRFVEDDWNRRRWAPGAWAGKSGATAWKSPVHLFPAGGRRLPAGGGRADLWAGTSGDVSEGVDNVYDLRSTITASLMATCSSENEREMSKWNFEVADTDSLFEGFRRAEEECRRSLDAGVPIAAYEQAIRPATCSTCCRRAA